jgi:hypothetical protein
MWSTFFPNGTIYGFDINDFSDVSIDRCAIFRGDMGNRADLDMLIKGSGGEFDVIIDDASHASHHQQIALAFLFPHLSPGGLYIIEDLNYQPPEIEEPQALKTSHVLQTFQLTKTVESSFVEGPERAYLERAIDRILLCDSACPYGSPLSNLDALAIIFKTRETV